MIETPFSVLVIGLGNPDRGDDGIGALVAQDLTRRLPADVVVIARRGDLISLISEWTAFDAVICIDAVAPVSWPGRVHRLDLSMANLPRSMNPASSHALGLSETVALAGVLGQLPDAFIIYAIEGKAFASGEAMSPKVADVVREVADAVLAEVESLRQRSGRGREPRELKSPPAKRGRGFI